MNVSRLTSNLAFALAITLVGQTQILYAAISSGESDWFAYDLTIPSSPTDQTITPSLDYPTVFGGMLGDEENEFIVRVDLSNYTFEEGELYFAEIILDTESTTIWPTVGEKSQIRIIWRVLVDTSKKELRLDDSVEVAFYQHGENPFWPSSESGYNVPFPLSEWTSAQYRFSIEKQNEEIGEELVAGTLRLAQLKGRHSASFSSQPVVLLHGYSDDAGFFADGDRKDSDFDDDFDDLQFLGGRLASDRPAYTLEVPNTGDMKDNALMVERALRLVADSHSKTNVDVVAHSMGGVTVRYYKQFLASPELNYLDRFVSIGSPFEGTVHGGFADGGYWDSSIGVESDIPLLEFDFKLELGRTLKALNDLGILPKGLDSIAAKQLNDPQQELSTNDVPFWANDDDAVAGDPKYLGILGMNPFGVELLPVLLSESLRNATLINALKKSLYIQSESMERDVLASGSDGLTTWSSGGKQSIDEKKNLYVFSTHTKYNRKQNLHRAEMLENIVSFLDEHSLDGNYLYTTAPGEDGLTGLAILEGTRKAVIIRDKAKNLVTNAVIVAYDVARDTATVISTLSDEAGRFFVPTTMFVPQGIVIKAMGVGFDSDNLVISTASARTLEGGVEFSFPDSIEVEKIPEYDGPLSTSVSINGGNLSTDSLTVSLRVKAINASEISIGELGDEIVWVPYVGQSEFTFAFDSPGEKTIAVSFRSGSGTEGAVATDSIIYSPPSQPTATLKVTDLIGGATVVLNGVQKEQKTPLTLSNVPVGTYTVSVFKSGVAYLDIAKTVTLVEDEVKEITFERTAETQLSGYLAWLSQYLDETQIGDAFYSGESSDPDGDGLSNYFEFLALLNPLDRESNFKMEFLDTSDSILRFRPAIEGVNYELQYSFDLETWNPVDGALQTLNDGWIEADLITIGPGAFYQVEVSRDLPASPPEESTTVRLEEAK